MRRAVALPITAVSIAAVSIVARALAGIVTGAAAPAFAATPAPLSGTADALTQSASDPGTWTTTAYLNTAAGRHPGRAPSRVRLSVPGDTGLLRCRARRAAHHRHSGVRGAQVEAVGATAAVRTPERAPGQGGFLAQAVGTLIGTVLTASSGVAALLPPGSCRSACQRGTAASRSPCPSAAADHAQACDQSPAERHGRHDRSRPDGAGRGQALVHRAGGHHLAMQPRRCGRAPSSRRSPAPRRSSSSGTGSS